MMVDFTPIFDGREIPGAHLGLIGGPVADKLATVAPRFAEWLSAWCEAEADWREKESKRRPREHAEALPPVEEWTDAELAGALRSVTALSFAQGLDPTAGELVDRLVVYISETAAARLEKAT